MPSWGEFRIAQHLNKSRILITKLVLLAAIFGMVFGAPLPVFAEQSPLHETLDMLGLVLLFACALGRLYCTAFLGGYKNAALVMHGPFSISRNPLYFCSFLGACGIALISSHLILIAVLPTTYCLVYFSLIRREEAHLMEQFGESYREYCARVPRFFPKFSAYTVPETVTMYPRFLHNGLKDSLIWLSILPLSELVEYAQQTGLIVPFFLLP